MKYRLFSFVISLLLLSNSFVFAATLVTPSQSGLGLSTSIDTDLHRIYFDFDFSALPQDYEQIVFKPPMFPWQAIPWEFSSVSALGLTEWNLHGLWPGGTPSLELQFLTASPPPRVTTVTIKYDPVYEFTGNFLGAEGDENLILTMRSGGGELPLWIYSPELQLASPVPLPAAFWLMLSGITGLVMPGFLKRK